MIKNVLAEQATIVDAQLRVCVSQIHNASEAYKWIHFQSDDNLPVARIRVQQLAQQLNGTLEHTAFELKKMSHLLAQLTKLKK